MFRKPKQVFLLYETVPSDPYEPDRFNSVHATLEGAQREVRERPLRAWPANPQPDGSIEAKPYDGFSFGAKIVPVDLGD